MRLLRLAAAVVAAVLITASPALAAPNRDSGKGDSPHGSAPAKAESNVKNAKNSGAECPHGLACRVVPAAYAQNSADPGDYGNYDLADRPDDGLGVRFIVLHDTEVSYDGT